MATTPLTPDFRDFLKLLNSHAVDYLLIGGYAVAAHGYARHTKDMDVLIAVGPENARRVERALKDFGFAADSLHGHDFGAPGTVFMVGRPPNRIDLLTSIPGVEFADAFARRVRVELEGVPVPVIGLEDLKTAKLASGRGTDLIDVDELTKIDAERRRRRESAAGGP